MSDAGCVTRECPYKGCGWEVSVSKVHPEDTAARNSADTEAERHFENEHCGKAKVRVVLEREVMVHPDDDLQSIVDRNHDTVANGEEPAGFEVAWASGEELEEADDR